MEISIGLPATLLADNCEYCVDILRLDKTRYRIYSKLEYNRTA